MSLKVLLVTTMRWPFAARLAGAFAAAGARVEALCPPGHMLERSRHPQRLHRWHPLRPGVGEALNLAQPDLIVPCDDPAAQLLWRFAGRATPSQAARLAHALGDRQVFPRLVTRNNFLAEARLAGVAVAQTVPVASPAQVEEAADLLGLPVVVKADQYWGGDGVVIARTPVQALDAFTRFAHPSRLRDLARAMRRRESHLLLRALMPGKSEIGLQRFVDGHPATSSIACWRGALAGANHFDVVVSAGTGPATVVAPVACPQMADAAARIARHFGLSGLYGLDYMRDADGQVHLLEINARATPTAHLPLAADLAAALVNAAGGRATPRPSATDASRIALFPQEWNRDPASPWLQNAFADIPRDDPALVAASLPPDANMRVA